MKKVLTICIMISMFVALSFVLTGCSNNKDNEPIKIGLLQPLTGPIAATGTSIRDGTQMYEDYINENGGINGRPIKLIVEDTGNDPVMASSAINKLITQDKVDAIIGAWGSSPTLAAIPTAKEYKIPMIVETASNYKITDKDEEGSPYIFRLSAPSLMEMAALKSVLKDELGFNKPYLISANNDWGRGNVKEFTTLYEEKYKLPIAGSDFIEPSETDFTTILTKVLNFGADSILLTGDAAQIALIVEQANNLGIKVPKLGLGMACCIYKIEELAGKTASENFYQTVSFVGSIDHEKTANPEMSKMFVDAWNSKGYKYMEIQEAARGFDSLYVMCEALKSIEGDVTSASIRDALDNVECNTMSYGHVNFTSWGNLIYQNVTPVAVIGIKDGKETVVLDLTYPVYEP